MGSGGGEKIAETSDASVEQRNQAVVDHADDPTDAVAGDKRVDEANQASHKRHAVAGNKLIPKSSPIAIPQACSFIRSSAFLTCWSSCASNSGVAASSGLIGTRHS